MWTLFRTGPATARHRVVWPDLARDLTAAALTASTDARIIPLNSCYVAVLPSARERPGRERVRPVQRRGRRPAAAPIRGTR
jgi:hypothetical protein